MILVKMKLLDSDSPSSASARPRKSTTRKPQAEKSESRFGTRRRTKGESEAAIPPIESAELGVDVHVVDEVAVEDIGSQGGAVMSQGNQNAQNLMQDSEQEVSNDQGAQDHYEQDEYYPDSYDEGGEYYGTSDVAVGQNQIVVTLSYSLMNQVRQTARMEGVLPEDIIVELVAEGVTRRAFEDAQRPAPSHLMTRTGYVAPDANGNVMQPQLSHHGMQGNNRQNQNRRFNQNNNRGHNYQGRNRQNNHFKNKQRNGK